MSIGMSKIHKKWNTIVMEIVLHKSSILFSFFPLKLYNLFNKFYMDGIMNPETRDQIILAFYRNIS